MTIIDIFFTTTFGASLAFTTVFFTTAFFTTVFAFVVAIFFITGLLFTTAFTGFLSGFFARGFLIIFTEIAFADFFSFPLFLEEDFFDPADVLRAIEDDITE